MLLYNKQFIIQHAWYEHKGKYRMLIVKTHAVLHARNEMT